MTAPLPGAPVIVTPAMRAAFDADLDDLRTGAPRHRALVGEWVAEARERTFGPLDAWLAGPERST